MSIAKEVITAHDGEIKVRMRELTLIWFLKLKIGNKKTTLLSMSGFFILPLYFR